MPKDDIELTSLGIFQIKEVSMADNAGDLSIQVSGLDRAQIVADAVYEAKDTITGGTNFATAIEDIILEGYGTAKVSIDANAFTSADAGCRGGCRPLGAVPRDRRVGRL